MKTFFRALMLWAALAGAAAAQTNLAGTWQGVLEIEPGKTLAIHFVIAAKSGGDYSAVVTSPDSGAIKNVPATRVTFADNKLTVDVPTLSGGYVGTLRNGVIEGEWSQEGAKMPLSLRPYKTPTLTKADIEALRGEWFGKYTNIFGIEITIVFHFSAGADNALRGVLDIPEQGVKDWATADVSLDQGYFSVKVPAIYAEITGLLKGGQIVGQLKQLGNSLPLTLKKGRYVAAASYLDLPAEAREQLNGRWGGALGPLTLIVRFEKDAQGRALGFLDMPQQNIKNMPITEATLADTKLTFAAAGYGAKYTGGLADGKLTGEWTQGGMLKPVPLVLTRGYVAAANYLDLPAAAREQLKGRWSGVLGPLTLIVRFETDAEGRVLGFLDSPNQNTRNISITEAKLAGTKFTFGIALIGGKYTGELAGSKLTGEWVQTGMPNPAPLALTREK